LIEIANVLMSDDISKISIWNDLESST